MRRAPAVPHTRASWDTLCRPRAGVSHAARRLDARDHRAGTCGGRGRVNPAWANRGSLLNSAGVYASEPHTYVRGHCVSYGQAMAYQPVLTLLRHALRHCRWRSSRGHGGEGVTAVSKRSAWILSSAAPYLLHLLGSATESEQLAGLSSEEYHASTLAVLMQLSLQSSRRCPLVIEVEDLHWIDATSEAWLAALAERLGRRAHPAPGHVPDLGIILRGWASPMPRRWRCHG